MGQRESRRRRIGEADTRRDAASGKPLHDILQ
jgi:hypothetical protein